MSVVDVEIGKRVFQLACADGQEAHLKDLAGQINIKVRQLAKEIGTNNDTMLYVMSALMIQDELNEVQSSSSGNSDYEVDIAVAEAINTIAGYVETVADRIEKA